MWKVFRIQSGEIIKTFPDEDSAKEWLESKDGIISANFEIDEMDPDEEEEWLEANPNEPEEPDEPFLGGDDEEEEDENYLGHGVYDEDPEDEEKVH